jgi:DNA-binding response OmpR family regulator
VLGVEGYNVATAGDGRMNITGLKSKEPSPILLDVMLQYYAHRFTCRAKGAAPRGKPRSLPVAGEP